MWSTGYTSIVAITIFFLAVAFTAFTSFFLWFFDIHFFSDDLQFFSIEFNIGAIGTLTLITTEQLIGKTLTVEFKTF